MSDPSLKTGLLGLKLRSPIIVASSGLTANLDRMRRAEDNGAGAVVMKGISDIDVMRRSPSPRFRILKSADRSTLYSYEQASEWGPEEYAEEVRRAKESLEIPVFVNIDCNSPQTWRSYTETIAQAGPDAIEVNISCPHGSLTFFGGEVEKTMADVARMLVSLTRLPLVIKLSPQLTSPPSVAKALEATGVSALTMFNRLTGLDVDITSGRPIMHESYAGHGGPWAINYMLRWVAAISPQLRIPILASGGVSGWEDAVKCILCGAAAVQVCTLIYTRGYEAIQELNLGISRFLEERGQSLDLLRGRTCSSIKAMDEVERKTRRRPVIDFRGVAPCREACPAGQEAMGYVTLIRQRKYWQALRLIKRDNPFPAICGRVCHHPCETACTRAELDEPVAIAALKRFVADMEPDMPRFPEDEPPIRYDERVAVIGSGPAGLTAARDLRRAGYAVTVFERKSRPGGMLHVIAPFRLPREVIEREIRFILDVGVELRTDCAVGRDISFDTLQQDYDAVLIAVGAQKGRRLGVLGEDARGVTNGLDLLEAVENGDRPRLGPRALVFGGGDVAIDCARSAVRLGASATVVYRRDREQMPAHDEQVADAEAEGVRFVFLVSPIEIVCRDGNVAGVCCIRNELGEPGADGRPAPIPVENSEFLMEADSVITAVGQDIDAGFLAKSEELAGSAPLGTVRVRDMANVFAAGDAATGPASLIEAIACGRRSAEAIHRHLRGLPPQSAPTLPSVDKATVLATSPARSLRQHARCEPVEERIRDFREVTHGLTEQQALMEAERCLGCSGCAVCGECARICIYDGIEYRDGRMEVTERCDGCGLCLELCPNLAMSLGEPEDQ